MANPVTPDGEDSPDVLDGTYEDDPAFRAKVLDQDLCAIVDAIKTDERPRDTSEYVALILDAIRAHEEPEEPFGKGPSEHPADAEALAMYRVTEQEARVVEHSYDIDANNPDDAQYVFESMSAEEKDAAFVHAETIRMNVEVVSVEEIS